MKRIWGYIENGTGMHQSNMVWDISNESPTITTIEGGGTQQIKILVRVEREKHIGICKIERRKNGTDTD
jgi:hypothetical protein